MMRNYLVAVGAAAAFAAACGDNSKKCDPGTTMDEDGVCVGIPTTCTDGTVLVEGTCEIDPNSCQDGTVLVDGACVDPGRVTPDLEEAAEPNGLGLFDETSTTPAGEIKLKAAGQPFVIRGKIKPFQDGDGDGQQNADIDAYTIEVTTPIMLTISSDGLHGLAAGFVALSNAAQSDPLSGWVRFGVNPRGDTSKRQLYLPVAGTYVIGIADTRTLFLTGSAVGAEEGKPDLEYYVSIDRGPVTPTQLTATNGVATSSGTVMPGETKVFAVTMGQGINSAELAVTAEQVQESLVVVNNSGSVSKTKTVADGESGDGETASADVLGIRTGDTQIVVLDQVAEYANAPYDYDLSVTVRGAGALPTNGTTVSQPSDDEDFSTFYYDVAQGDRLLGMDIAFDRPVSGAIVDENFQVFSAFTLGPFGFSGTFEAYKGLLNHRTAGRYYFVVFDPDSDPADITATSTYAGVAAPPLAVGTELTAQTVNAYQSNAYTYNRPAASVWQQFTADGTDTGTITASYYDPSTAFGRLDPLVNTCGAGCNDAPPPVFAQTYAATGTTRGRIMLDDTTSSYLVKVDTATTTGTTTFDYLVEDRAFVDLGTAAVGTPVTAMDQTLDATTTFRRYLVRTGAGNRISILAHPDVATLNTAVVQLSRDEGGLAQANDGAAGADDTLRTLQAGGGWTAFVVGSPTTPATGDQFDVTVTAAAPITYTTAAGTTTFDDACTGGTALAILAPGDSDEGRTAVITAPADFDFFGLPATQFRVFANGFLSFDTSLACATATNCFFTNADIPLGAAPNALVAPFWDDLLLDDTDGLCQKTVGTKLIIQWRGFTFAGNRDVAFQAILDGATDTIEFVYATGHAANGDSATIGIENQVGAGASKLGFNAANTATSTLFTPM